MLALGIHPGERVRLRYDDGTVVWVKLETTDHGKLRLFIDAPLTVQIDREKRLKAHDEIEREQQ